MAQYEYDALGRLVVERNDTGRVCIRNTYNAIGQLVWIEREGVVYHFQTVDRMPSTQYDNTSTTMTSSGLAQDVALRLADGARNWTRATVIRDAIPQLDEVQSAVLCEMLHNASDFYVDVVDSADLVTLFGEAQRMLPGQNPLQPILFQANDRWLMLCTNMEDTTPERRTMLDRLLAHSRLQRRVTDIVLFTIVETVNSIRILGSERFLEIDSQVFDTPSSRMRHAFNSLIHTQPAPSPTAVTLTQRNPRRFGELLIDHGIIAKDQSLLVLDGDMPAIRMQVALPRHNLWHTCHLYTDEIASSIELVRSRRLVTSEIVLINGAPGNKDEITVVGRIGESVRQWQGLRRRWTMMAAKHGIDEAPGAAAALLENLQTRRLVIVTLAYSKGRTICFPDGSSLDPAALDTEICVRIRNNAPVACIISCKTGSLQDIPGLVRSLLDAGACGVIAPSAHIPARRSAQIIDRLLGAVQQRRFFLDALWDAIRGSYMEFWIGQTAKHK